MKEASPAAESGMVAPGFEGVARVFDDQLGRGLHFGSQLCVKLGGKTVVDRWGGFADGNGRRPITPGTPFMAYSATKAFTATCIHKLADSGALDLELPVARYWPEFGAGGKDGITLAHVLLHQAGIPGNASPADLVAWLSPRGGAKRAAAIIPVHAPGERVIYHPFSGAFVLGELIRRVSGMRAAEYLTRSFLKPLGMADSYAGLPVWHYGRASRIHNSDPAQNVAARVFSNPVYRSLFLPAASLNTTARDLATFYDMLREGGTLKGRRYLSESAIARATALRYDGPDGDTDMRVRWAMGFGLGGYSPFPDSDIRHMGHGATENTFGHSGQGGCAFGWADPPSGLVFAFTCNRFQELSAAHGRFQELADACWNALGI